MPMKFGPLLQPARIALDVAATSRKRALEELARLLASGAPTVSEAEVANRLFAREKLGSTRLPTGVCLPHARVNGLNSCIGAVLRLKHPVMIDTTSDRPVDLLIGLIVPLHAGEEETRQLIALAEVFADEFFCTQIRAARDTATVYTLLTR